jgi:alpha-ketoglutarate-dependent taurine dioxygenase
LTHVVNWLLPTEESIENRISFLNGQKLPVVIEAQRGESLLELLESERESLEAVRLKHGAILLRGFGLDSAEDFRSAAALAFKDGSRDYVGGVSPRGKVMAGVYESTRFPAHMRIPQHNEMAYLPEPPRGIAFFCETEPRHGGETPLADARAIHASMDRETRTEFEMRGISYHRYLYGPRWNLHDRLRHRIVPLHTSWMAAFATEDPAVVARCCAESGSKVEWDKEEGAKINNVLPAVRQHPETGETLWFNQVSTFLSSPRSTGLVRWMLYQGSYRKPLLRPFHATFGDGQPIGLRQINAVNEAIDSATIRFRWRKGDLLLLDNYLITHGRMPYRGERRILVAIH